MEIWYNNDNMATNLYEFYKSKGQELPSVASRKPLAEKANIADYTGTKSQNEALLGYLQNTPTNDTTISPEKLAPETLIKTQPVKPVESTINKVIDTLLTTTNEKIKADEAIQKKESENMADLIKSQGTVNKEGIYKENLVNEKKALVNSVSQKLTKENEDLITKIEDIEKNREGKSDSAIQAEINQARTESARRSARYGIELTAVSNDYKQAYDIATTQIDDTINSIKYEIEAKKFILEQAGTKLATNKAQAFTLQLRALDNESALLKDAIGTATEGIKNGTINSENGYSAIQELISGETSISDFYNKLGVTVGGDVTGENIGGYDITSYATDPQHEQKVMSIYSSIPVISDAQSAQSVIDKLSPNSPITGKMVMDTAKKYGVDPSLMIALMQQDSSLGTAGLAVKTKNAGNVGNDDAGNTVTFSDWGQGVDAVGKWLSNHKSTNTATDFIYGDFTKTLTPQGASTFSTLGDTDKTTVMQLVNGDALIADLVKSRGATGTKEIERLTNLAKKVDPAFSINSNKIKYEAKKQWNLPNGKAFLTRSAMNTAMSHMAITYESSKLLGNIEIPKYNEVANWLAKNTGNPELTNFVYDLTALAGEVASAYKNGTAPTDQETEKFYNAMSGNMSPEQLKGVFTQASKLMGGKLKSLAQEYKQSTGSYPSDPIIQPSVLEELKNSGVDVTDIERLLEEQGYNNTSMNYDTGLALQLANMGITDAGNNTLLIPRTQWSKLTATHDEVGGLSRADALLKTLKDAGYTLLVQ